MRRNIIAISVFLSTIISGILSMFPILGPVGIVVFMLVFNVLCLLYYRETRLIISYHVITMFLLVGFFLNAMATRNDFFQLLFAFVAVGSFGSFFISFGIILQNKTDKRIEISLLIITLFNLVFYSFTRYRISTTLIEFFAPNRSHMLNAENGFMIANYILLFLVGLLQVYLIFKLDERLCKRHANREKRIIEIENHFY